MNKLSLLIYLSTFPSLWKSLPSAQSPTSILENSTLPLHFATYIQSVTKSCGFSLLNIFLLSLFLCILTVIILTDFLSFVTLVTARVLTGDSLGFSLPSILCTTTMIFLRCTLVECYSLAPRGLLDKTQSPYWGTHTLLWFILFHSGPGFYPSVSPRDCGSCPD